MSVECHRDGPWDLPEGWVWTRLGQICTFIGRGRGPSYVAANGVPVINQKCIRWRRLETEYLKFTARPAFDGLAAHLKLQRGDILWNSTGTGTMGRALVYDGSLPEATVDTHVTIVRPNGVDPQYLCYFIETMRVQHLVVDANVGSTNQLELPRAFIQSLEIPLPPLAEQQRIVMRVAELFTEIEDGETMLIKARDDLETWRCAMLRSAVNGKLTQEWRAHNRPNTTGADLVRQIKRDIALENSFFIFNGNSGSVGLPDTWAWCSVGEAGEVRLGRQRSPQHHSGKNMRPYLRVANVYEDRLDLTDVKRMNFTPEEFRVFQLKPGDVLLNEGQSPVHLGRPALYSGEIDGCCFQNTLLRFRPRAGILPEYALNVFRHYMRAGRFKREARITTNLAHLSHRRFAAIEFPVPPTSEQYEIVRLVKLLETTVDEQFAHIEVTAVPALQQSILKAAFQGRLLNQDADDEPAEVFIARLAGDTSQAPAASPRCSRHTNGSVGANA
jgi:type I restriction enzyme, S subunit